MIKNVENCHIFVETFVTSQDSLMFNIQIVNKDAISMQRTTSTKNHNHLCQNGKCNNFTNDKCL